MMNKCVKNASAAFAVKSHLRRHALPLNAVGSRHEHAALSSVITRGNLIVLVDPDGGGFKHLAAEVSGQGLQSGNVLDL